MVIGASAGGIETLSYLIRQLPPTFRGSIFIVMHFPAQSPGLLPQILSRYTVLPVYRAIDGDAIRSGHIYIAPPDHHLLVGEGTTHLSRGARENRHRPAVDVLFRSAAASYGPRAIGVVLSGTLDDGTAGLGAIKRAGGTAIVQDPNDALYAGMPMSAIANVDVDFILPMSEIVPKIVALVDSPAPQRLRAKGIEPGEPEVASVMMRHTDEAQPSLFSCPDCGGVLFEMKEGDVARYRCRVGHAYAPESMLNSQADRIEAALWEALKTLEESAVLSKRLARQQQERGHEWMANRFAERERDAIERAKLLREVLTREPVSIPETEPKEATGTGRSR